jgi:coiled-coil domain-containing protein 12
VEAAKVPEFHEVRVDPESIVGEDPEEVLINVAPKKPNWDLRRDVAEKLSRLERRTQAAMIKLMAEEEKRRLEEEGGVRD